MARHADTHTKWSNIHLKIGQILNLSVEVLMFDIVC